MAFGKIELSYDDLGALMPFAVASVKKLISENDLVALQNLVNELAQLSVDLDSFVKEIPGYLDEYTRLLNKRKALDEAEQQRKAAKEAVDAELRAKFGIEDLDPEASDDLDDLDDLDISKLIDVEKAKAPVKGFIFDDLPDEPVPSMFEFDEDDKPATSFLKSIAGDDSFMKTFPIDLDSGYSPPVFDDVEEDETDPFSDLSFTDDPLENNDMSFPDDDSSMDDFEDFGESIPPYSSDDDYFEENQETVPEPLIDYDEENDFDEEPYEEEDEEMEEFDLDALLEDLEEEPENDVSLAPDDPPDEDDEKMDKLLNADAFFK